MKATAFTGLGIYIERKNSNNNNPLSCAARTNNSCSAGTSCSYMHFGLSQ